VVSAGPPLFPGVSVLPGLAGEEGWTAKGRHGPGEGHFGVCGHGLTIGSSVGVAEGESEGVGLAVGEGEMLGEDVGLAEPLGDGVAVAVG
jgi:hypothetical protein